MGSGHEKNRVEKVASRSSSVTRGTKIDNRNQPGERARAAIKKAFAEIKSSEDRLRTILDAIPVQAWSRHPDGAINYFNRRWHEYTGLSPKEAYGGGGNREVVRPIAPSAIALTLLHSAHGPSARRKGPEESPPAEQPGGSGGPPRR